MDKKKGDITFEGKINISFNLSTPEREFYSSETILTLYLKSIHANIDYSNENIVSYYNPHKKAIYISHNQGCKYLLVQMDGS